MSKKKIVIKKSAGTVKTKIMKPAAAPKEEAKPRLEAPVSHTAPLSTPEPRRIPDEDTLVVESSTPESAEFKFYCVYCGQKLSAKESMSGRAIRCPTCTLRISIPAPPPAKEE